MRGNDHDWAMTGLFLLALAISGLIMKLIAMPLSRREKDLTRSPTFWILLSPSSHDRLRPLHDLNGLTLRTLFLLLCLIGIYWVHLESGFSFAEHHLLQSYSAAPALILVSEGLVALATWLWIPSGRLLPTVHHRPWTAHSIGDFWGRRWNLWFSDWFRYAIFSRFKRTPIKALFITFTASGLIHEFVINLPLYLITGKILFGTMMIYFLLQPIGILLERRLRHHPVAGRAFTWLIVFVPAPLVINEGLLEVLQLTRTAI